MDPVKKLDDFVKGIMKNSIHLSKINHDIVEGDNIMDKIQSHVRNVISPFSKLWLFIEGATQSDKPVVEMNRS